MSALTLTTLRDGDIGIGSGCGFGGPLGVRLLWGLAAWVFGNTGVMLLIGHGRERAPLAPKRSRSLP